MIHLFLNAFAASAGGGLTYLRGVVPHLAERDEVRTTVLVNRNLQKVLGNWPNIEFVEAPDLEGVGHRFWFEQRELPGLIRRTRAEVLLSAGNIALFYSPVPQVLLSRNALYTSSDFENDLRRRGDYGLWLDTKAKAAVAKASIRRTEATVAPSAAFAEELRQWTGKDILNIHHGFDAKAFSADQQPLPAEIGKKLHGESGSLKLLFVSHYNYYRNFETLIRALPLLQERLAPRRVCLIMTCQLRSKANPGPYRADSTAALVRELGVEKNVVELGFVPYTLLYRVYRACDIYVTAAYAESFAHPLVEAMFSGLPVVASKISVHREICQNAALYFDRFDVSGVSDAITVVANSPAMSKNLAMAGLRRSADFTWQRHVGALTNLISSIR